MKYFNLLNLIFVASLFLVILIALGLIPRHFAFLIAGVYLAYVIFAPLENGVSLFLRSIPFFIALPITASFDNFNMWRIVLLVIFIRWITITRIYESFTNIRIRRIKEFLLNRRVESLGILLFVLATLSLFAAQDLTAGVKRIIYFANLAMLFVVVRSLVLKNKESLLIFAKNILIGAIIVLGFGYLQLLSVYFIPIDVWHHWWGEQISPGFYGKNWSDIVMEGNTWFSYTAGSLKLRMFSTFPDSHTFPLYLLMTLPFFLALVFHKYWKRIVGFEDKKWADCFRRKIEILKKELRALDILIFVIALTLALILSGTRGIWMSVVFPIFFGLFFWRRYKNLRFWTSVFKIIILFLVLFPLAALIWSFPQFQLEEIPQESRGAFIERIKSSFSTEETSNLGRIYIWKETLKSLLEKPFFGVGIGNYPVVLDQDVALAKAGSSAHNLYFNVAAEMGILAGIIFLWFLFEILRSAWQIFQRSKDPRLKIFGLSSIVFLLWVFGYSLTDAALFDERAFLIFIGLTGAIVGLKDRI